MAAAPNTTAAVNDAENRIVGMMVGSAVGDAIGIYTHDLTKSQAGTAYSRRRIVASYKANEVTPHYPDDHRAQYEDGNYSEVTEMALCTLLSLISDAGHKELPKRLRRLSRDGNRAYGRYPLDLPQPTKNIVESTNYLPRDRAAPPEQVGATAQAAALQRWLSTERGVRDRNGSNASLVRVHPVAAVATSQNLNWTILNAVDNCRFTHVDASCNFSAIVAALLLRGLIRGEVRTQQQITPLIQRVKRHIDFWAAAAAKQQNIDDRRGAYYDVPDKEKLSRLLTAKSLAELQLDNAEDRGDVRKCLGVGIFCLRTAMTRLEGLSGQPREDMRKVLFAELIQRVVMEGGAAQANAAFAGALLGAYLGYDAIPRQYREGLSEKNFLMRKSKLLCTYLRVITDPYRAERDSMLYPARNGTDRREMRGNIQSRRRSRKQMLQKRRDDPDLISERRRTTYGSLLFQPRQKPDDLSRHFV